MNEWLFDDYCFAWHSAFAVVVNFHSVADLLSQHMIHVILTEERIQSFQTFVWDFYRTQGRSFAWRHVDDPYHVLVSEIMLQQTQTHRVVPKYEQFVKTFPTMESLAQASLRDVLAAWQGLGYNRRGMYLHQIAQKIVADFGGVVPDDPIILETLPGIGYATARSICAFAFNVPVVFIETNIRAVFIACFFDKMAVVRDAEIMPLVEKTLDLGAPRDWYYALMDLGVFFKKTLKNPSRQSAHHTKQSKFEGSGRQLRGKIIRVLTQRGSTCKEEMRRLCCQDSRFDNVLAQLVAEGLVTASENLLAIG